MSKTALVTGGAGFLGSHLCQRLIDQGHTVVCLDNLTTGSLTNVALMMDNPRFSFIEHDVIHPIDVRADLIFNLACPASPVHYQADPIKTTQTSVLGITNMLELAKRHKARIFQASTSEVYGDPKVHPQSESYWGHVNCTGIRACYDEGKRLAESLMFDYQRTHGVEIRIARIFNTYGPHMNPDDGRVVSNFIVQALNGDDITVYGDGTQTRSFCYVDDLIEGFLRLMASDVDTPVNLGNPEEYKVIELAAMIIELCQSQSTLIHKPLPQDDPLQRCPDINKAQTMLDWSPTIDVQEGLKRAIEYFRHVLNQPQECHA